MANLFYGYLKSVGKKPTETIVGGNWRNEPPTDSDYVGVLKENIVQIDCDIKDLAFKIFEIVKAKKVRCDVLETTRGLHFYFKNSNKKINQRCVNSFTAIGIPVDIGIGGNNHVVPLKISVCENQKKIVNGVESFEKVSKTIKRIWLQTYDELDELPSWLRIVSKKDPGVLRLDEGGRNAFLFSYKMILAQAGLDNDEIRQTLFIINDYVLKSPLSHSELNTIARDENFEFSFFYDEDGKFQHNLFGDYLIHSQNIIEVEDRVYIFNREELFSSKQKCFEQKMLDKISTLKENQRKEVYKYIMLQKLKQVEFARPKYIGLKSEVLDIETMEKFPYNPNIIIRNKINYDYYENVYNELLDKTLNKVFCNDKDLRALFEEMVGYCLYNENKFQKAFIFDGTGSNGKSATLTLILQLLGHKNYTSLSLQDLESTFRPAELDGMLANIGDDIPDKYLSDTSVFKKCVTGEPFMVERKGERPFVMKCTSKFIFAANNTPIAADKTHGFERRLTFIPFNAKFSPTDEDYDPFILDKLISDDSINYLLKLAINGLKRLLTNNKFTYSESSETAKKEYCAKNNNITEWLETEPQIDNEPINLVYQHYTIWCVQNGYKNFASKQFKSILKERILNLTESVGKVNGKSIRIFKIKRS